MSAFYVLHHIIPNNLEKSELKVLKNNKSAWYTALNTILLHLK
jgi:hypothetical protein